MRIGIITISTSNMRYAHPNDYEGRLDNSYCLHAKEGLEKLGHTVAVVEVNHLTLSMLDKSKFDVLLNFCDEGFDNNPLLEPHVAASLDVLGIPYTGADYFTLSLCLNKSLTKKLLLYHRINTPKFQEFVSGDERLARGLKFPLFVKPSKQDGSIGIRQDSVVRNEPELRKKVKLAIESYHQPALVEEYIEGREFNIAILGHGDKLEVLPVSEIDFSALPSEYDKFCSYDAKWNTGSVVFKSTPPVCPAKVDGELYEELVEMAIDAFKATGCRDYARVDFRVDSRGVPYVLEVNPNPDISDDAGLANMASKAGMDYGMLLDKIVKLCLERHGERKEMVQDDIES
jgi:D-alanine-D-alanine ligase